MNRSISIRILQLKNNFYQDQGSTERGALGEYCVIGYFDAFDISKSKLDQVNGFNTWSHVGKLTVELNGSVNCRMLVCVTDQQQEDRDFWDDQSDALFFVTMVRVEAETSADEMKDIVNGLWIPQKRIGYLSYDHSEIIVVFKTNRYSEGIEGIKKLRSLCNAIKTYTVFAIMERCLESYESIQEILEDEKVFCRLHCMVKDYTEAEQFQDKLEKHMSSRNGRKIKIRRFETFGGYDWLMELDDVSICSILECYKMKELLTHTNADYNRAFFNIESEILVGTEERDGDCVDRGTETTVERNI